MLMTTLASRSSQLTICLQSDAWFSGSHDSEVRKYALANKEMDGLVTSAAGVAIRSMAVDPKGSRIAVTSECVIILSCIYQAPHVLSANPS